MTNTHKEKMYKLLEKTIKERGHQLNTMRITIETRKEEEAEIMNEIDMLNFIRNGITHLEEKVKELKNEIAIKDEEILKFERQVRNLMSDH